MMVTLFTASKLSSYLQGSTVRQRALIEPMDVPTGCCNICTKLPALCLPQNPAPQLLCSSEEGMLVWPVWPLPPNTVLSGCCCRSCHSATSSATYLTSRVIAHTLTNLLHPQKRECMLLLLCRYFVPCRSRHRHPVHHAQYRPDGSGGQLPRSVWWTLLGVVCTACYLLSLPLFALSVVLWLCKSVA